MGKATFDLVASSYPLLEWMVFGATLSRARDFFVSQVVEGENILLIGEGNGRFLFDAVKQNPSASFTVIDSSARMLAAAERRLATADRSSRIEWIHADILEWQGPDARYDRIVTHFFLDLFTPPRIQRIAEKILHLATEDPLWINSDFVSGNQCLGQKFIMWAQYRFFRIFAGIDASRLCDPLPCLRTAGWEILEKRSLESGWISAHLMSRGHKGVHRPRLP